MRALPDLLEGGRSDCGGRIRTCRQCRGELVDFFHTAEQLKAALDSACGETNGKGRRQYEKYRQVLRDEHGGVERVIRGLRYLRGKHPRRRQIRAVLGYFRRHRQRMDYAGAAKRGYPIGSGVVEAACKTLVTERLKRSGMRWREAGAPLPGFGASGGRGTAAGTAGWCR